MSGTLYVVGTPIGNLEDITLRALRILTTVEVIVCEDTRVTQKLLSQLTTRSLLEVGEERLQGDSLKRQHVSSPLLVRSDEYTQLKMIPKVMKWLATGTDVALTTDAGMPTISDPGWRIVNAVREEGYSVEVIPGPTALTSALAISGMDVSKVWFVGFLPKKEKHRQEIYAEMMRQLSQEISTAVAFYESPQRLKETLQNLQGDPFDSAQGYKSLKVAACGELTKMHEKVIRGTVEEVVENLPAEVRGEWVVVVGL